MLVIIAIITLVAHSCVPLVLNSVHLMKQLVHTERALYNVLSAAIAAERVSLNRLCSILEEFRTEQTGLQANMENPIEGYSLTKRIVTALRALEHMGDATSVSDHITASVQDLRRRFVIPSVEDWHEAAGAVLRLQVLLDASAPDIARRCERSAQTRLCLDAADCLRLGKIWILRGNLPRATEWLQQAVFNAGDGTISSRELTKFVSVMQNQLQILKMKSDNQQNVDLLLQQIFAIDGLPDISVGSAEPINVKQWLFDSDKVGFNASSVGDDRLEVSNSFVPVCRGEITLHPSVGRHMCCLYLHNNDPYLLIQPVETEVMYTHPLILVFHNVINDHDISEIISVANRAGMMAAQVNDVLAGGEMRVASYRTSSSGWLSDQDSSAVRRLSGRISSITGLDTATAEHLQVANYGAAGHYSPHYDDLRPEQLEFAQRNGLAVQRRIATFMVYGSDVALGGGTAFPLLNITISPNKGSAVFWYNMLPSGDMDVRTLHGGCPVIIGDKWVFNKWISPDGQMFRLPCGLEKYDDIIIDDTS